MTSARKKQKVTFAWQLLGEGKPEQAESLCAEVLSVDDQQAEAWFVMGWIHRRRQRTAAAIESFQAAARIDRRDPRFHNALGAALAAVGRFEDAAAALRTALELRPAYAEAHGNFARVLWLTGNNDAAEKAYQASIRLAPTLPEAQNNYGNFLRRTGRAQAALEFHRKAVSLNPAVPEFHLSLGAALLTLREGEQAAACFRHALVLRPDYTSAAAYLGHACYNLSRWQEARVCFDKVLQKHPDHADSRLLHALVLERLGEREKAIEECKEALRLMPGSKEAELALAAMQGAHTTHEIPIERLTELFNTYADRFDDHLVGQLNYRAPQLILDALRPHLDTGRRLDVIDLGCGTGLVGALLRPYAASLAGVDLAPKMIERARIRGIYDHLEVGDVTETLLKHPAAYDLVVAGDVFVYVGDLAPVFRAAHAALRPGGLFAFTVELHDGDEYVLRPSRRFAHPDPYIRKVAAEHALPVVSWTQAVLRTESNQPVQGLVVVLRRDD